MIPITINGTDYLIEVNHYHYEEQTLYGMPVFDEEYDYTLLDEDGNVVINADGVAFKKILTNEVEKKILNKIREHHGVDMHAY